MLGALFVVAAFTLFGLSKSAALCRAERTLRAFIEALDYMRCELQSAATPLPELFAGLKLRGLGELNAFFSALSEAMDDPAERSFSEVWSEAAGQGTLSLSPEQRAEITRLGLYLGRFPAQEQCAAIDGCIAHLTPEHENARRKAAEGKKLWTGLGLAAGLMLVTVLI